MTNARRHAIWILLCVGISIWWGSSMWGRPVGPLVDFKAIYYGAQCLIHHRDPYNPFEFQAMYLAQTSDYAHARMLWDGIFVCVNLPTSLFIVAPLAILSWNVAQLLWLALNAATLALAAILIWKDSNSVAPVYSLLAVCIVAANAEILFAGGNISGIVVSLGVLAAWCFANNSFVPAGIAALGLALAMKPHDVGFVWLCFMLLGSVYRKWAFRSFLFSIALALPALGWAFYVAPHWVPEFRANLATDFSIGGINEPGPFSPTGSNAGMVISLQSAIKVLTGNPAIYNFASYLVCGGMLVIWALKTISLRKSRADIWVALAACVSPTLLITYHRLYDAKLLLLTIPACAILWSRRGITGWLALFFSTGSILLTSDVPLTILMMMNRHLPKSANGVMGKLWSAAMLEPTPAFLLAAGIFYLWVYVKCDDLTGASRETADFDSNEKSLPPARNTGSEMRTPA